MSELLTTYHFLLSYAKRESLYNISDNERLELLNRVAATGPSQNAWLAITELFAAWNDNEAKFAALDRTNVLLNNWDPNLRYIDSSWKYLYQGNGLASVAKLIKRISINNRQMYGNTELKKIAGSLFIDNLVSLQISKSEIYSDGIATMAASPHLKSLAVLVLHDLTLSQEDIALFFTASLPALYELHLNAIGMNTDKLKLLLRAGWMKDLRGLDLSYNLLDDESISALSSSNELQQLRYLNLSNNFIRVKGAEVLANATSLQHLEWLNVSGNRLYEEGKTFIRNSAVLKKIRVDMD